MLRAALICLFLSVLLGSFAWWGLFTAAGNQAFDEMDGMIPFAAGVLGAFLAISAALAWGLSMRR
ncbi:hypothetical protein EJV46_19740 [Roseococcus sp. SYP-B2431]|uniref:hypothetical protein n=1 Tax=Roseococcus sp. SYP-B2431 TaxID=2496640 RepID=UPI00103CB9FA|nr:hypothetical protein [Roseococcus sp. SYP-B2431]TCH96807.1 hypothetical protein EJV46_19740 [Roseococcus sp. SYP-B2431]